MNLSFKQPHWQPYLTQQILQLMVLILPLVNFPSWGWADDNYKTLRHNMINTINEMAKKTGQETGRNAFDQRVMEVMAKIPRHKFVPADQNAYAYQNRPLPIGHGQTISQPYIVALMTDILEVNSNDVILEIGTGSGYQAAILSKLASQVYTIEIIEKLGKQAQERFAKLAYNNIEVQIGDGYYGWEEHAPFDSIIVTAAANHIPPSLIQQLKPGGRMIIPVGERFYVQHLTLVEKDKQGQFKTRQILPVAFVPFTRGNLDTPF